jgi:hypothetical protein
MRNAGGGSSIAVVPLLIDSGAGCHVAPALCGRAHWQLPLAGQEYELIGFDGTRSSASAVSLEVIFLGRLFQGRYLLIEGDRGVLGRDVLNHLVLLLDGPKQ